MRGLFVTGTDTDVGKTWVTSLAVRAVRGQGVRCGAYKPVCSGAVESEAGREWADVESLFSAAEGEFPRSRICPQAFTAALAPPVAAREEGKWVDGRLLRAGIDWWRDRVDVLFVEGVGGLLCPLTESESVCDLAAELGFPVLIVARAGLGTINHTLLTVEVACTRGLNTVGIVLNEDVPAPAGMAESNAAEIGRRCDVPVLGVVRHGGAVCLRMGDSTHTIEWLSLAGEPAAHESRANSTSRNPSYGPAARPEGTERGQA